MARKRTAQKDRTSLVISVVLHLVIIGGVIYWAHKTGRLQEWTQKILQVVRSEQKRDKTETPKTVQPPRPPPKASELPKINEGARAPIDSGTRRSVAADAPESVGDTFFVDTRKQASSASGGGSGASAATNKAVKIITVVPRAASTSVLRPAAVTSIKQLLAERAKSSTVVESYGTEQISKSGVSDVSDIVGKISGASVADGKFAVVRGLADRYTLATLNGADVPSADPNRRAVQLDLFPAQFVSRVDVNKTFTPDLPGGFAGGAINIVTRAFPEKPILTFSAGTSYNTQASLNNDYLVTDRGGSDWRAKDDGTRALPDTAAATSPSGTQFPLDPAIKDDFKSEQFAPVTDKSPLNRSFATTFGDTTTFLGHRLGLLAGVTYKNDYNFYDDGEVAKYDSGGTVSYPKSDARSTTEYTWGSMVTLAYEVAQNHGLYFNFMYVQTAEDEARRLKGQDRTLSTDPEYNYVDQSILHWTERNLTYFQLKGEHQFPEVRDVKLDWVGSIASTTQDEPDHRIFQFLAQPGDPEDPTDDFYNPEGGAQPPKPTRIFRSLQEDNAGFRMDLTIPLSPYGGKDHSLKTGFFTSQSEQTYDSRAFEVRPKPGLGHPFYYSGDPNSYLAPTNQQYIDYYNFVANFQYVGEQTINAGYFMGTWAPLDWLRLVGGIRYETTDISVDTVNLSKAGEASSSRISQEDLLPAINATISLRTNLQLRAAWSKTVVRPTYREISRAEIYDVAEGRTIKGNTNLTMAASENYDLRLEWYPRPGELISIGGFYKKLDEPIEQASEDIDGDIIFYNNYDKADVYGVEVELRKTFPGFVRTQDQFSIGLNYAYIKSIVPLTDEQRDNRSDFGDFSTERPLYDQPEFVFNGDLTYENFASGTTISLQGGIVGRRLVVVGYGTPDEFEEPAPQLEFSIAQKLWRRWKVKFSAKNLLNPEYKVTQDWPLGAQTIKTYTKGITLGLTASFEF